MSDDLNADWRDWDRAICQFFTSPTPASLAAIKNLLNPDNVLGTGCEVVKHPDCCLICRDNERCERLPLHPECRCKRRATLTSPVLGGNTLAAQPSSALSAHQQGVKRGPS